MLGAGEAEVAESPKFASNEQQVANREALIAILSERTVQARGMQLDMEHPDLGIVPRIANSTKFSRTQIEYSKAPLFSGKILNQPLLEYWAKRAKKSGSFLRKILFI